MIEATRKLLIALACTGLATACSWNPKPKPPEPPPPEPQCLEGQTTCCWHRPPGNEWLYACPAPNVEGGVLNVAGGPAQCPNDSCGSSETPPKGQIVFPELELRQPDPPRLTRGGKPFTPFGCISCCEKVEGTGWPGFSTGFVDFCGGGYGANFFHFRFGPWYGTPETEAEWSMTGGAYKGNPGEPLTLEWNPAFWQKARDAVYYAGKKGANVQAVLIDTWYCKTCGWGSQPCAWPREDIEACGRRGSPEQERFIRKVVEEIGCFQNVVWMTGNESNQIQGATIAWQEWVISTVAKAEAELGCGVVHMKGVDGPEWEGAAGRDYVSTHAREPLRIYGGVHSENNERNPEFSPEQELANAKAAEEIGGHWWAWRGGASDEKWRQTLELRKEGSVGPVPVECFAPPDSTELWEYIGEGGPGTRVEEVKQGQSELGSMCKEPKNHQNGIDAIEALNAKLRQNGYCSGSVGSSDAVMIQSENGPRSGVGTIWEEHHAVAPFDTGCWSTSNAHYPKSRWKYLGQWSPPTPPELPPPTGACTNPDPIPLSKWGIKEHTKGPNWTTVDSTPLVGPDAAYCASIGFTDGRNTCPVRQEGDPLRPACESEIVGGYPTWSGPGEVSPDNPYQYLVRRGTGGLVTVCGKSNVCGSVTVTP